MKHLVWLVSSVIAGSMSLASASAIAQAKVTNVPDAQVEADVLKALAANPKLSSQTITSTTVYGTVTISGSVRDEDSRKLAETIVSRTAGVQKVIDELTLNSETPSGSQQPDEATAASNDNGSNPLLQSDGTLATPPAQQSAEQPSEAGSRRRSRHDGHMSPETIANRLCAEFAAAGFPGTKTSQNPCAIGP